MVVPHVFDFPSFAPSPGPLRTVEPLEASPSPSAQTINYVWTTRVLCKPRARVWWSVAQLQH